MNARAFTLVCFVLGLLLFFGEANGAVPVFWAGGLAITLLLGWVGYCIYRWRARPQV